MERINVWQRRDRAPVLLLILLLLGMGGTFWAGRGVGLAREAASAALIYAHGTARLDRVIAVAREDNFASRQVLNSIGMSHLSEFSRAGNLFHIYQSVKRKSRDVNSA